MSRSSPEVQTGLLRSPLARRLATAIILLSTLITLVVTSVQLYWLYRSDLSEVEQGLEQIKQVHLKSIAQSLWAANRKELAIQLEGLHKLPSVEYAAVYEGDTVWAQAGARSSTRVIVRDYPLSYQYRDHKQTLGHLEVIANLDQVLHRTLEQGGIILASNAFKTFLVAGFMLLIFHRQINKHLGAVTRHLGDLDLSQAGAPFRLQRKTRRKPDEFDALVSAINRMQASAYSSHEALNKSMTRFHAIADYTVDWESWLDAHGKLIWVNPSVTRMTGYTPDECLAMPDYPVALLFDEDERYRLHHELKNHTTLENTEFRIRHKDGETRWMAMSWQPVYDPDGVYLGKRCSARDIGRMKQLEMALQQKVRALRKADVLNQDLLEQAQQEKARMTALLAAMNLGILLEDIQKRVVYYNPVFRRIWMIPDHLELAGKQSREVLEHSSHVLSRPDLYSRHIMHPSAAREPGDSLELETRDGRTISQTSYPVHDDAGALVGRLWIYEDITQERQTAQQLIYLAERDSLTGLYNRHRFQEEMARMLSNASRRNTSCALLFFDLDEFKHINDSFGHRAGDSILIRIAGELNALVRQNEILARLGGDEFALLLPDADATAASGLAERIVRAVAQIPFSFEGQNLRMTTSMGIAVYPQHGDNAEDLVAHADAAMYQAKAAGKNGWALYCDDQQQTGEMLGRLTWHERVCNALEKGLFVLHFQGVYDADSLELKHLEALVRMRDEQDREHLIMPGHFIPPAEKTGKILDIDRWVIAESIRVLAEQPQLPAIAVNISGRSFDNPQLPAYIAEQLNAFGVAPGRLMVELTETAAVGDLQDAQRFIESLQTTGCRVCLDDFGSGFSSFSYLKYLRADILKIDGVFIRDLDNDRDNQTFVKAIVDVARGLNKITVAEFVESAAILELLRKFGVDLVQGYHLDTPQACHAALQPAKKARPG